MTKRAALLCVAAFSVFVTAASPVPVGAVEPQPATTYQYGDVVRIGPATLMGVGRALDVANDEADVGNAISTATGTRCT